jgi:DNA-binding NarL/FixJ family response regulator
MRKQVFIADDNKTIRNIIKFLLKQQTDLEVCGEAADGLQAVKNACALKPDLVLLDLAMPKMNGAEAASVLKRMMPDVPIILFTMYGENIGKCLQSAIGVDVVLTKPEGMTRLVETINAAIALSSEPESLA